MGDLSDANLRAVLAVLLIRMGGEVEIGNAELYDAMMPQSGVPERLTISETSSGVRVSFRPDSSNG